MAFERLQKSGSINSLMEKLPEQIDANNVDFKPNFFCRNQDRNFRVSNPTTTKCEGKFLFCSMLPLLCLFPFPQVGLQLRSLFLVHRFAAAAAETTAVAVSSSSLLGSVVQFLWLDFSSLLGLVA